MRERGFYAVRDEDGWTIRHWGNPISGEPTGWWEIYGELECGEPLEVGQRINPEDYAQVITPGWNVKLGGYLP